MAGSAKRDDKAPRAVASGEGSKPSGTDPGLDRAIQARIGDKLRAMYGELSEQPIPDRLTAILSRLGPGPGRGAGS